MLNQILKVLFALPALIVIFLLAIVNVKLYEKQGIEMKQGDTVNVDLLHELRGLKKSIGIGADEDMQELYPEGYVFLNATYGLAWCNFLEGLNPGSELYKEGKSEIEQSFQKINSDLGRSTFDEELPLPYGAFYNGWSTYLLGRKLFISDEPQSDVLLFKKRCASMDSAITSFTFPETYYGNSWPADVMLCVASLSLHDKLFTPKYDRTIQKWIEEVKSHSDTLGLIPHSVRSVDGKPVHYARGSSQSLMLIFLHDIDKDFGKQQYSIYKENYIDTTMGLTGVREYPKGEFGFGDVDSGPLLFGYGASATIVGMQTLSLYGDYSNSSRISSLVNALGLSYDNGEERHYLFGQLPIADAFIAWGHSVMRKNQMPDPSFLSFHLWSVIIILLLSIIFWWFVKNKKPKSADSMKVDW